MRATVCTSSRSGGRAKAHAAAGGFSLIELAVVVFIVALLLGSILVPIATQVEQRQIAATQKILDETREAIIGFAVINGRLPRPAVSFSNGAERSACITGAVAVNEANCTGFVPWTALGTSKLDPWGKIIRYSVTPAYADSTFSLITVGTKLIQTRDTSSPFALINMVTGVPAVIFSHGRNNYGTSDSGAAFADGSTPNTNIDEDTNASATVTFIFRPYSGNTTATGGEFDDIVSWVPATILFNRMVAAGKLP
jgi:type II secretory pathway pseudopilin PulG